MGLLAHFFIINQLAFSMPNNATLLLFVIISLIVSGCDEHVAVEPDVNQNKSNSSSKPSLNQSFTLPDLTNSTDIVREHLQYLFIEAKEADDNRASFARYADALFINYFYNDAKDAYMTLAVIEPSGHKWFSMLAVTSHNLGQTKEALDYIRQANQLNDDHIASLFFEARLMEETGNYERAKHYYQIVYSKFPDIVESNFALGKLLFNMGQYERSRDYLEKAMQLSPQSSIARAYLIRLSKIVDISIDIPAENLAYNEAQLSLPHPYYEEVMTEGRTLNDLRFNINRSISKQDSLATIKYLKLLITHYNDRVQEDDFLKLSHYLTFERRLNEAKKTYLKAINRFPSSSTFHLGFADIALSEKKYELAREHYENALSMQESDNDKARSLQGIARIIASKGEFERALSLLNEAAALWKDNPIFQMDLMRVNADLGRFEKAFFHLEKAEELGFNIPNQLKERLTRLATQK